MGLALKPRKKAKSVGRLLNILTEASPNALTEIYSLPHAISIPFPVWEGYTTKHERLIRLLSPSVNKFGDFQLKDKQKTLNKKKYFKSLPTFQMQIYLIFRK